MSKLLRIDRVEESRAIDKCIDRPFSYNSVADCSLSIFLTGCTDPCIRYDMRNGVDIPANCPLPDVGDLETTQQTREMN